MPVLFVGHGSPMNAIEHNKFTETLTGLGARFPRPKAVCVISAHWTTDGTRVLTSDHPETIHDFYGFPPALYEVQYPAPGAPEEAERVASDPEIKRDQEWGLDHGSWSVLRHMYPEADVPAFQLSLDERRDMKSHLALGREIASLRERGVLIVGSGNIVHNLRKIDWNDPHGAYDWAVEFDAKVKSAVDAHDTVALANPHKWGEKLLATAHPTVEHYLPLLYCMGATDENDAVSYPYEGFDFGSISMRAVLFGGSQAANR
ncbi:MAG TPA: 4,5-DOPA dioxygenase extradiol [Candidatus Sulfotelmatobacter sp.]|nr:4,5-DOPA dioxygenase extradiol [Candidatus Sulfotelmatobacter sp.]